jgi:hypothetical protein
VGGEIRQRKPFIYRDFPTTVDALDASYNGEPDIFVTKVNPSGSGPLAYSTFLGGTNDEGIGIALDASGSFYVTGFTRSPEFPTTVGAFDTTHNGGQDAFITKFAETLVSTSGCEVTTGGWIIAANGDRASFGGHVKVNDSGEPQGNLSYVDHGPTQRLNLHSINILTIVCDGSRASISGQATINGSDGIDFQINVQDLGKGEDTYQLLTDGYDSGEQVLRGGNIQIHQR